MTTEWDLINSLEKSKNMRVAILFQIYQVSSQGQIITTLQPKEELELALQFQSTFYSL